jgi:HEAT repeat protein
MHLLLNSISSKRPKFATRLERPDFRVRGQATVALRDIAPGALTNAIVFSVATNALHSADANLRVWAATALRAFGQQARCEVPTSYALKFRQDAGNPLQALADATSATPRPAFD